MTHYYYDKERNEFKGPLPEDIHIPSSDDYYATKLFIGDIAHIVSHPHTFSGESRVIPPNQIEWKYEWLNYDLKWVEVSEDLYETITEQRRRVATPKITGEGKDEKQYVSDWEDMVPKPPLGLMPKWRHDELRLQEIQEAIDRYSAAGREIPEEWVIEMASLKSHPPKQSTCASVNQGMECMCANEGYDMTQCPHYKPLTAQPDKQGRDDLGMWVIDEETKNEVLSFIEVIRNSFKGSVRVYTLGSCYQFFKILQTVFPDAKAYYNSDHVITKIGDRYYDITGEVHPDNHLEMDEHYPHSNVRENMYEIQEKSP